MDYLILYPIFLENYFWKANGYNTNGRILRILSVIFIFSTLWSSAAAQDVRKRQLYAEPMENALDIDLSKSLNYSMTQVDEFVSLINSENFSSYENLAIYLKEQFRDRHSQARSIYSWIALNVSYDQNSVLISGDDNQSAGKVWKNRKAVCEGYANLFNEMCLAAGIESRVINGYVKEFAGEDLSFPNHSWNSVKINGKWKLLDVTWASVDNESNSLANPELKTCYVLHKLDHFFLVDPNRMILTHLPEDPLWQLHDNYVDLKTFLKGEEFIKSTLMNSKIQKKDFEELISKYEDLDSLDKSISFLERMERNCKNRIREYGLGIAYYYKAQKILREANVADKNKATQRAKIYYTKSLDQLAILEKEDFGYEFSKDLANSVTFRIATLQ